MPVLEDEPGIYGYTNENRHMVDAFRKGQTPMETLDDGLAVVELLMALEDTFDVKIPDEEAEAISTVGEAVDLVTQKLGG